MAVGDAFGDFSEITFIDGNPPAINATNLNEMEGLLAITDLELERSKSFKLSEYLEYFRKRNQKDIDLFDSEATWSAVNDGTLSDDETLMITGNSAVRETITNNGASWMGLEKSFSPAYDLTEFLDESASTTDDLIILHLYISDIDAYSGNSFYVLFGDGVFVNLYEYEVDVDVWGLDTGWNVLWIPKSDFYVYLGAPNWNNIDYCYIELDYNAGYLNEYVDLNYCQMIRHDPVDGDYPNPFQRYMGSVSNWENMFTQDYPVWSIVKDIHIKCQRLGILKFNPPNFEAPFSPGNYLNGMLIYSNANSFLSKFEWICKEAGELPSITWYIDSTHYAEVKITSDTLYLSVANGGAAVDTTWAFTNALAKNEKVIIFFEKQDDTLRVICYKNGEILAICEYESSFSTYGDIYMGVSNDLSFGILIEFVISHSMNQLHLVKKNEPAIILKPDDEILNNNSTLQNDDDIWAYLLPNQTYKIEFFGKVINSGGSSTPDIKIAWTLTDCEAVSSRHCIGPGSSTTDVRNTVAKLSVYGMTDTVIYGVSNAPGAYYSNIQETFLIKASESGAKIQMQWAQNVATAVNTFMKEDTMMIITPVYMR